MNRSLTIAAPMRFQSRDRGTLWVGRGCRQLNWLFPARSLASPGARPAVLEGGFHHLHTRIQHRARHESGPERCAETQVEDLHELAVFHRRVRRNPPQRSEENTSELQL